MTENNFWHEPRPPFATRLREVAGEMLDRVLFGFAFGTGLMLAIGVWGAKAGELAGRLHVIDGDTARHYAPGARQPEKIRLLDIDAPESFRATCEAELIAGLRAKARLAELLQARPVRIERCDEHADRCEDRFGRTLARLHTPSGEVGAILMREGHAMKYEPGRKAERTAKWCSNGR